MQGENKKRFSTLEETLIDLPDYDDKLMSFSRGIVSSSKRMVENIT